MADVGVNPPHNLHYMFANAASVVAGAHTKLHKQGLFLRNEGVISCGCKLYEG